MNIGIIGTGSMGRALGLRWARAGHSVLFGSRDLSKAKAVAAQGTGSSRAGDFDAAAAFGEVVLYTARDVFPSSLLREPRVLAGKIVIDCNNHDLGYDQQPPIPSLTERLAADVPEARIVKAFSTIPSPVIELPREELARHQVSVFLSSDDAAAKATVKSLAEELGFVGVDGGGLVRGRLVDGLTDFLRYQIGAMGLGGFATMSLKVLRPKQGATS
jgi:predicted dinucleotide-binding enzyme